MVSVPAPPSTQAPAPAKIAWLAMARFAGLLILVGPAHLGNSTRVSLVGSGVLVLASLAWSCGSLYSKHGALPTSSSLAPVRGILTGGGPQENDSFAMTLRVARSSTVRVQLSWTARLPDCE